MEVQLIPFDVTDDSYLYLHVVLSISVNAVANVPDNDVRRRAGAPSPSQLTSEVHSSRAVLAWS